MQGRQLHTQAGNGIRCDRVHTYTFKLSVHSTFIELQIHSDMVSSAEETQASYRLPSALLGSCRNCS
mgnify:CR=1 FL=1